MNISSRRDVKNAKFMEPGTGGVSMFALLICLAAGIRPIITSSSNKKLEVRWTSLITELILNGISEHFILPTDEVSMSWLKM
jgi:NADPH:quinone reductase-like Zn-dependent oxidoreductase